jgi:hypothetical protein
VLGGLCLVLVAFLAHQVGEESSSEFRRLRDRLRATGEPRPWTRGSHPGPLAQGVLTGKYVPDAAAPSTSRFAADDGTVKRDHSYLWTTVLERVQNLRPLAEQAGLSMAAFCRGMGAAETRTSPRRSSRPHGPTSCT